MATAIRVPDLGTTVDEVKLLSWLVEEGDDVHRGDVIAEIQTDKATSALESVAEGVLLKRVVPPDTNVAKGDILAYVGKPGEAVPETGAPVEAPAAKASPAPAIRAGAPRVSPIVRNLASKLRIDLSRVEGTGKGGIITREDVQKAVESAPAAGAGDKGEPLSRAQSAVAKAVLASVQSIPHLRVTASVDMTAAQTLREEAQSAGLKLSYDAIFLKALAMAIDAVPIVAAKLHGERIAKPHGRHIALAIGSNDELLLPVVRDVDRKDLSAVQSDIVDLADRAERKAVRPEELTGGCMALSNLGMYPIDAFDAIIFPEHSAILAVGSTRKKAVVVEDGVEIRPVAEVTLSVDHRLINGRAAAQFVTVVKKVMESGEMG